MRSLIFQKKIVLNTCKRRQIVTIPSLIVRKENENNITKLAREVDTSRTIRRDKRKNDEKAVDNRVN